MAAAVSSLDPVLPSRFFNVGENWITIMTPSDEAIESVVSQPISPFHIPQRILATVPSNTQQLSGDLLEIIAHLTGFPAELCLAVLSHLSYRDFVLLALTSKSMAIMIMNDPVFIKTAATEEAEHNASGHLQIVVRAFPHLSQHRSKLWCSHYTCPFHMRRLRNWNRRVEREMKLLQENRAKEQEATSKHTSADPAAIPQ
ncbi:hypothetical protein G647_04570 [Cladophialophora carrionii CBS 160.54]|uniref:F-box domain-containing protein n=1 Tax=Cladophialophora carrionii CBS 160.54 TaxID=1279043 RepID=V9DGV4_9EURO|nr:uncharacterized protein G647_04570 [Cladophialophora carrionii CBS 160.54]ETI25197.1 hypothetical protein G647_04570 [Cladophialophora carrionii CBS 160.54]